MAAVNVVVLLVLGVSLVFAALPEEHHLNVRVKDQDVVTSESIDVNYKRKYVKISSSGSAGTQAGSMLHDYTQGWNVLKRQGECYILNKFKDIPEDIKDWERVESSITDDIIPDNSRHMHYGYNALPYLINRTTSPPSVQQFCPGPIRIVVLDDVIDEDEPRDQDEKSREDGSGNVESRDDEPRGEVSDNEEDLPSDIYIPDSLVAPEDEAKLREKRGWRRVRFRASIRARVRASVRARVRIRTRGIRASVRAGVRASVRGSASIRTRRWGASISGSARASVRAGASARIGWGKKR